MATVSSRGTSVVGTVATTWASTTNAYDGSVGTDPATYATWINAARSTVGQITLGGYTFSGVTSSHIISGVTVAIRHMETPTVRIASITVQLQDSTGANIGAAATNTTLNTAAHTDTLTLGTPTNAQVLAGLRVLVTITRTNSTTSTTFSLDQVDLTVDYHLPAGTASGAYTFAGTATGALTVPSISILTDNFDTKNTDIWTWSAGAAAVRGRLSLPTIVAYNSITSRGTYNLTNNSVSVALIQRSTAATQYSPFRVTSAADGTDYIEMGVDSATPAQLYMQLVINSVTASALYINYDPVAHKYFRIRHSGTTMYWDTSPDGQSDSWTNRYSYAQGGLAVNSVLVQINSGNVLDSTSGSTTWDDINHVNSKIATFTDSFTTKDTSKWTWDSNADVVSGQLNLVATNGYPGVASKTNYDLTASSVSIEVKDAALTGGGEVGLSVRPRSVALSNTYIQLVVAGSVLGITHGQVGSDNYTIPYNSTNHRFLRIREAANEVYWEASANGLSWTTLEHRTNAVYDLTEVDVYLYAGPTGSGTGILDNLNLLPAGGTYTFAGTATGAYPRQPISELVDTLATFDNTTWVKGGTNTANVVIANSELEITVGSGTTENNHYRTVHEYDFNEDAIGATVRFLTPATNLWGQQQNLQVDLGSGNAMQIGSAGDDTSLASTLGAYRVVGGSGASIGTTIPYSSTDHAWIRIREEGGTWYFDSAPDSNGSPGTWTNRWTLTDPYSGDTVGTVNMQETSWQALGQAVIGKFVNFNVVALAIPSGTASGTYTWAGSASGVKVPSGTSSGTYTWAGSATGKKIQKGTGSGTYTWAGSATGSAPIVAMHNGTASGTYAFAGSASGVKAPEGTGSGTYTWVGSASGARASAGSGGGAYVWASNAAGGTLADGTAAGTYRFDAEATGYVNRAGTTSGVYGWAATASGTKQQTGSGAGTYTFASEASGVKRQGGSGTGTYNWAGSAEGVMPAVAPKTGSSSGTYDFAATSSGVRAPGGSCAGTYTWAGLASGVKQQTGTSSGGYGWAATASGYTTKQGTLEGGYSWASTASGETYAPAVRAILGVADVFNSTDPSVTFLEVPLADDIVVIFPSVTTVLADVNDVSGWINPLDGVATSATGTLTCAYHVVTPEEELAEKMTYTLTGWFDTALDGVVVGCVVRYANSIDAISSTFGSGSSHTLPGLNGAELQNNSLVLSCAAAG
jgi:hypothetical protein